MEVNGAKLQMKFKGVRDGQTLRIKGKGGPGSNGGPAGDILVTVSIPPFPGIERKGDDLYVEGTADVFTAILGGKITVQTPTGSLQLTIPKETDSGKKLRLKGKGMPRFGKENESGDLYVTVKLVTPKNLSDAELEKLSEIAYKRKEDYA